MSLNRGPAKSCYGRTKMTDLISKNEEISCLVSSRLHVALYIVQSCKKACTHIHTVHRNGSLIKVLGLSHNSLSCYNICMYVRMYVCTHACMHACILL